MPELTTEEEKTVCLALLSSARQHAGQGYNNLAALEASLSARFASEFDSRVAAAITQLAGEFRACALAFDAADIRPKG